MTTSTITLLLGGLLAGFWPKFSADPLENPFPLEAKGNVRFQVDAVVFKEAGAPSLEVDIAIPLEDLAVVPTQGDSLGITLELLNEDGDARARFSTSMWLPPDSTLSMRDPSARRSVRLYPRWIEGTRGLRVVVVDLGGRKRGLLDQMRDVRPSGEAAARLSFPTGGGPNDGDAPAMDAPLSGILFARGLSGPADAAIPLGEATAGTNFRSLRARLEPNPYRTYGRSAPVLTFYWERYRPTGWDSTRTDGVLTHYGIYRQSDSLLVRERSETLRVEEALWDLKRFDVADLPTGTYFLEIALRDPVAGPSSLPIGKSRGAFQIVWDRKLERLKDSELTAYARVLLPAQQFEEFTLLDRGGREAYLQALWDRYDPTTPGEPSALESVFYARVRQAEEKFGGWPKGLISDRGRVFVRFGEPDEVSVQLNPQDEELLWQVLPQEIEESADDATTRMHQTRHRTPLDNRAYEIWEYAGRGDPLLPDYVPPGQSMNLKFIFVDEFGVGDYSLVYTNLFGGLQ